MKKKTKIAPPMRLREVAEMLGFKGRFAPQKVLRHLRRLERERGVELMTRTGQGRATRYTLHLSVLRENHPELFYRRDEAAEALREYIEEWDERLARTNDRVDTLARLVSGKIERLTESIKKLEESLAKLSRGERPAGHG